MWSFSQCLLCVLEVTGNGDKSWDPFIYDSFFLKTSTGFLFIHHRQISSHVSLLNSLLIQKATKQNHKPYTWAFRF